MRINSPSGWAAANFLRPLKPVLTCGSVLDARVNSQVRLIRVAGYKFASPRKAPFFKTIYLYPPGRDPCGPPRGQMPARTHAN